MQHVKREDRIKLQSLFKDWNETMIWSYLQGYYTKNAYTDNLQNPKSAQIIVGDFCFFAGIPNYELVKNIPTNFLSNNILMVPEHRGWEEIIEQEWKERAERTVRYAIKKEKNIFNKKKLYSFIQQIPSEYQIVKIEQKLYEQAMTKEWSKDLCSQFKDYDDYKKNGYGYGAIYKGELAAGASSYTIYKDGIEIEIDTQQKHRKKGLALACAARLILECLSMNLYPSWDAANLESVAIAEKLGYHLEKEYITYRVQIR